MRVGFILDIVFLVVLAIFNVTDLKKRIIPNSAIACLILLGILHGMLIWVSGSSVLPYVFAVLITLPGLIAWRNGKIGGGDIKLLMGMGFYLGIWQFAVACIGMLILCLIYLLFKAIRKEKSARIPFAPFLLMSAIFPIVIGYIFGSSI